MILNFDLNLPCRTSPRWCSRGSRGDFKEIFTLKLLYSFLLFKKPDKEWRDGGEEWHLWLEQVQELELSLLKVETLTRAWGFNKEDISYILLGVQVPLYSVHITIYSVGDYCWDYCYGFTFIHLKDEGEGRSTIPHNIFEGWINPPLFRSLVVA